MAQDFGTSFLSTFLPSFQQAQQRRSARSQAELEAQQLQDREKQALIRTLLGDENVAASAKNQLLASILPQFAQSRQVEERVSAPINEPAISVGRQAEAVAPSNLPTMQELPDKNRLLYTNMMTPVGLPTAPRGGTGQSVVSPATGYTQSKTVTEPMTVFQDKAEKKTVDPILTEAGQTIFKLYQEGKVPEAAVREFLPSYQEAIRTGDFSKLKIPAELTKTADEADANKLKKVQLDLQNRGLDIQKKTLDLEQKKLEGQTPFALGDKGTDLTLKLSDRAVKQTEDYQAVVDNYANMTAVLDRMRTNPNELNRIVTDQAVINSFNKILDPKSVVREGEYQRTEDNQALLKKANGWLAKIFRAGTTLTESDLNEIQETAAAMGELRRQIANKKLEKLRKLGQARGLNPDEFAPLLEQQNISTPQTATPAVKTPNGDFGDEDIDKLFNK